MIILHKNTKLRSKLIQPVNTCMQGPALSHILINQNLLYYNIIRPMLLYGGVTWIMNKYEERKLVLFENKILRKISGLTNESGEQRIRHTREYEIRDIYKDYDIRENQRNETGLPRFPKRTPLKDIGLEELKRRRPPGRPKCIWQDRASKSEEHQQYEGYSAADRERMKALAVGLNFSCGPVATGVE